MSINREHLWQAYLDGELTVIEMSEFETSLDEDERERLAAEMRFEGGLAERLSQDVKCPDEVWERTKALLTGQQEAPAPSFRRWYWGMATLATAATLAFMISLFGAVNPDTASALVLAAETVEELAATSETDADVDSIRAYLADHDIELELNPVESLAIASTHRHLEVIGVRTNEVNNEPVVEILFGCCGRPVKVMMAAQGSDVATLIGLVSANGNGEVQATRTVGHYLVAVVSDHPTHGLLDIFVDAH
ncbi:MAG: hypothetical protein IIB38_03100 [Candidatus Hydrogenedentes bacterium]|nr:hypothetical protein [Candidatus Hydrogenedentota bacterium]